MERGQTNRVEESASRTYGHILRANIFTRFNAILSVLLVVILVLGSPADALFGFIIVINALIGIIQEIRAKWTLDRLHLVSAPLTHVIRDGEQQDINVNDVVLDDLIRLGIGDQLVVDGAVLSSDSMEIDESLLTGEALPVVKAPGDEVFSGSFVVAGGGLIRATKVGEDAYARKLASQARQFTLVRSELRDGINRILRWITWILFPVGALLLYSQFKVYHDYHHAIPSAVAGLVGMIPQGLVLLTSIVFAVSVIDLARRNVLVQELPAVEGLARVDVVCLDKTGTLTDGNLVYRRMEGTDGGDAELTNALAAFAAASPSRNATLEALATAFPSAPGWVSTGSVPFSSARKWSAESFEDKGTWLMGAPEMMLKDEPATAPVLEQAGKLAREGWRVLLVASSPEALQAEALPGDLTPHALLLFEENVRPDTPDTLHYFEDQQVALKIISGDNPETVGAVAKRAGVEDTGEPFDARGLPEDQEALADFLETHSIFGRVTPRQKEEMVLALQSRGHVAAMTGDGVNDVLALKKADMGIAMGSGSPATKAVAQIVLIDGKFSTLPAVVAHGRRVIANIERVSNLFITKTIYATLISLVIGIAGLNFVFLPRNFTLLDALTISTPAFFLSLAPNKERYHPGFLGRVLRFTIPAGTIAGLATLAAIGLSRIHYAVPVPESRTVATMVLGMVSFWVLIILARPFTRWRYILVISMIVAFAVALLVPGIQHFFELQWPTPELIFEAVGIGIVGVLLLELVWRYTGWRTHRRDMAATQGAGKEKGRPSR